MSLWKVLVTAAHPGPALAQLADRAVVTENNSECGLAAADLAVQLADKDAVVSTLVDRLDDTLLSKCPTLKVIANVAVGFDNIDIEAATAKSIAVVNTPGVLDDATADLAFGLLLACARRICQGHDYVKSGSWTRWQSQLLLGTQVAGKTIGVVGFGRIGQAMARRARGFGMKVIYSQRRQAAAEIESELAACHVELDTLLGTADFVSLHCPLTEDTRHLIDGQALAKMQRSAILINTARGAIVDERALVQALAAGTIAGAGLDVFEHEPKVEPELLSMDNVVLAPHIGSASVETRSAMYGLAVTGLAHCLQGRKPDNLVNPSVWDKYMNRLDKCQKVSP